jgi:hypothetical protein
VVRCDCGEKCDSWCFLMVMLLVMFLVMLPDRGTFSVMSDDEKRSKVPKR